MFNNYLWVVMYCEVQGITSIPILMCYRRLLRVNRWSLSIALAFFDKYLWIVMDCPMGAGTSGMLLGTLLSFSVLFIVCWFLLPAPRRSQSLYRALSAFCSFRCTAYCKPCSSFLIAKGSNVFWTLAFKYILGRFLTASWWFLISPLLLSRQSFVTGSTYWQIETGLLGHAAYL